MIELATASESVRVVDNIRDDAPYSDAESETTLAQPVEFVNGNNDNSTDHEDEFDSDVSDDELDDEMRPATSYNGHNDVPQLVPEAHFLIGTRSRFGRTVR
ncbi:Hypothetical predicted protein [Paramuricea clavata]|uniref:Uncharacterized protein n=1 Tax=Paramuricea clavata TaxID=317549 RepID=A0A7D9E9C2_PARCT|nr:Hypothetical predicted protein [Paramuricea clavata]